MATREQEVLRATDPDDDVAERIAAARARREQLVGGVTETTGRLEAFARGAVQGATFEFGDEISAGARALMALAPGGVTPGEQFEESVEEIRAKNEAARVAFPVASAVGTVVGAGGVTLAGGAALTAARGAATGGRIGLGRLAALGAAEGAVVGAGAAEGVVERIRPAATGAAVGAVAAPLVAGAGRLAGAAGSRALDITGLRPSREAAGVVGRTVGRIIDPIEERAEQGLAATLPEGQALADAVDRLSETTRPLTIMDIDRNVAARARALTAVEGRAKEEIPEFLAERVKGQGARVIDDAFALTGAATEEASVFETLKTITTRQRAVAQATYDEAFQHTIPRGLLADIEGVGDILSDPIWRKAYDRGVTIAAREGKDLAPLATVLAEGAGTVGPQQIPVEGFDFMKQAVDDVVTKLRRKGANNEARILGNQVRRVLRAVDNEVPSYGRARALFAGDEKLKEALALGQQLFNLEPAEARAILAELGQSEREMFVRGGLLKMSEFIERPRAGADIASRRPLFDAPRDVERMRLLFPTDEAFATFQRGVVDEATIAHQNRFVTGQSATAEKLIEFAQFAGGDVQALLTGSPLGLFARAAAGTQRRLQAGSLSRQAEATIPMLTATGPRAVDVIQKLTNLRAGVGAQLSLSEAVAGGVVAGSAAGVARPERDARERVR